MGAAAHLGIDLRDYDRQIRTFIPSYDELLGLAAHVLAATAPGRAPVILDLGIGTGALSAQSLHAKPAARIVGIDEDQAMLDMARARLGPRPALVPGSFERADLPRCDAIVASLALHHVPTRARRARLFRRCFRALRSGGVLLSADCYLSASPRMESADRHAWLAHLQREYAPRQARRYLRAWAKEDVYVTLIDELRLLEEAGFRVDVAGRRGCFAVIAAER